MALPPSVMLGKVKGSVAHPSGPKANYMVLVLAAASYLSGFLCCAHTFVNSSFVKCSSVTTFELPSASCPLTHSSLGTQVLQSVGLSQMAAVP